MTRRGNTHSSGYFLRVNPAQAFVDCKEEPRDEDAEKREGEAAPAFVRRRMERDDVLGERPRTPVRKAACTGSKQLSVPFGQFVPATDTSTAVPSVHDPVGASPDVLMTAALSAASSSGQRGRVQVTQFVQHAENTPETEYQFADRIHRDVYKLHEPHLLLSVLKTVERRIQDLKQEARGNGGGR